MKARSGFVSNSSSSSFVIAWKGEYDEDDLCHLFKKVCGIPKSSPLSGIHESIFNRFMSNIEESFNSIEEYNEWCSKNCYDRDENNEIVKLLNDGFVVRRGSCSSSSGDSIDYFFSNHAIKYNSDDFAIINAGVY